MTFRFNLKLRPAIVAHTYNCLGAFFSRLDEAHAHSADDVEMSFVCAHTNISRADCRLDCVVGNCTVARLRRRLTGEDHTGPLLRIAPRIVFDCRMPSARLIL
jgi:hypothetical protein